MQAWWAEETSFKNIKNSNVSKLLTCTVCVYLYTIQTIQMSDFTCWLLLYMSISNTFEIPKLFNLSLYFCIYLQYRTYYIRNGQSLLPFVFNDIMGLESGESNGAHQEDIAKALEGLLKEGHNVRRKLLPVNLLSFKVALWSYFSVIQTMHWHHRIIT